MTLPCIWRGQHYPSQTAAARAANLSPAAVTAHLERHGHLDNLGVARGNARGFDLDGRAWPSLSAFAREAGIPRNRARYLVAKGRLDELCEALRQATHTTTKPES